MKQYGPSSTRSGFQDRNPARIASGLTSSITAGGSNVAPSYTVPAGRRAQIYSAHVSGLVTTVLAAGQNSDLIIRITKPGPVVADQVHDEFAIAAAAGSRVSRDIGSKELAATDLFEALVTITAGAGVIFASAGFSGVEYDV